jgi:hypothetical protein
MSDTPEPGATPVDSHDVDDKSERRLDELNAHVSEQKYLTDQTQALVRDLQSHVEVLEQRDFRETRAADTQRLVFYTLMIIGVLAVAVLLSQQTSVLNQTAALNGFREAATQQAATSNTLFDVLSTQQSQTSISPTPPQLPAAVNNLNTSEAVLTERALIVVAQATSIVRGTELALVQATIDVQSTQLAHMFPTTPTLLSSTVTPVAGETQQAAQTGEGISLSFVLSVIAFIAAIAASLYLYRRLRPIPQSGPSRPSFLTVIAALTPILVALVGIVPSLIQTLTESNSSSGLVELVATREAEATAANRLATLEAQFRSNTQTVEAAGTNSSILPLVTEESTSTFAETTAVVDISATVSASSTHTP